jgi:hypothetical protein
MAEGREHSVRKVDFPEFAKDLSFVIKVSGRRRRGRFHRGSLSLHHGRELRGLHQPCTDGVAAGPDHISLDEKVLFAG